MTTGLTDVGCTIALCTARDHQYHITYLIPRFINPIRARFSIAGSQREELHPWQRSWGRRLRHTQRRDDQASGNPLFPSIYPKTRVYLLYCFMLSPIPLTLRGADPPLPLSEKELTYSSKSIKIPGRDKSVSTYELLWRLSSLPIQVCLATCDCLQPPNRERHEMF